MPPVIQMIFFLTIVTFVWGGLHYYFYRRLVRSTELPSPWRRIGIGIIIALAVTSFGTMPASRVLPISFARVLTLVPFVWMGAMVFLLGSLLLADGVRLVAFGLRKWARKDPPPQARRIRISRWVATVSIGVTVILGSVALVNGLSPPRIKRMEVTLDRLDPAFDGVSFVQLTDLHIGPTLGREWLLDVVSRVNELNPDMVAITGDLMDGSVDRLRAEVAPLTQLNPPLGKFFVTGNHEYFSGAKEWVEEIRRLGFRVLSDETAVVPHKGGNLVIAGVDDFRREQIESGNDRDLKSVLAGVHFDSQSEAILLLHNPRNMLHLRDDRFGLVLTGHTHGGQIWPFSYLVRIAHPYLRGMYDQQGRTQLYVSEGTGFWGPPLRLGTSGEITHITLRSGA